MLALKFLRFGELFEIDFLAAIEEMKASVEIASDQFGESVLSCSIERMPSRSYSSAGR